MSFWNFKTGREIIDPDSPEKRNSREIIRAIAARARRHGVYTGTRAKLFSSAYCGDRIAVEHARYDAWKLSESIPDVYELLIAVSAQRPRDMICVPRVSGDSDIIKELGTSLEGVGGAVEYIEGAKDEKTAREQVALIWTHDARSGDYEPGLLIAAARPGFLHCGLDVLKARVESLKEYEYETILRDLINIGRWGLDAIGDKKTTFESHDVIIDFLRKCLKIVDESAIKRKHDRYVAIALQYFAPRAKDPSALLPFLFGLYTIGDSHTKRSVTCAFGRILCETGSIKVHALVSIFLQTEAVANKEELGGLLDDAMASRAFMNELIGMMVYSEKSIEYDIYIFRCGLLCTTPRSIPKKYIYILWVGATNYHQKTYMSWVGSTSYHQKIYKLYSKIEFLVSMQ